MDTGLEAPEVAATVAPGPVLAIDTTVGPVTSEMYTTEDSRALFSKVGDPLQGVSALGIEILEASSENYIPDTLPLSKRHVHSVVTVMCLAWRH